MNSLLVVIFTLVVVVMSLTAAVPLTPLVADQEVDESAFVPRVVAPNADLQAAGSGGHYGRVQIKMYHGPTTYGHHEHFAPHGFWVKQPADDHH